MFEGELNMANITICLDNDLLKQSRKYAERRGTILNAPIRDQLRKTVKQEANDCLEEIFSKMDKLNASSSGKRWKREGIYDV